MDNVEFIKRLKDVADNYKTLYVMGCFGAPMTAKNKLRYQNNHAYNRSIARTKMIEAASPDTFGFDCVNLIKGILWGWHGDAKASYGGAAYASNGVPDIGADQMIRKCTEVSTNFNKLTPGEAVWMPGHIGVYIGDDKVIECSPAFKNCVQYTTFKMRTWKKHGKIPYIEYIEDKPIVTNVSNWAKASWDKAVAKGILDGTNPTSPLTREQFAVVIDRLGLLG